MLLQLCQFMPHRSHLRAAGAPGQKEQDWRISIPTPQTDPLLSAVQLKLSELGNAVFRPVAVFIDNGRRGSGELRKANQSPIQERSDGEEYHRFFQAKKLL